MKFPFSFLIGLLLLVVLPQRSLAEDKPRVFRAVGIADDGLSDLFYDVKGAAHAFTANSGSFSQDYPAPAGEKLSFYRLTPPPPDAPAGTPPTKTVVAEIPYPKDVPKVILLLHPSPAQSALPITGMAIADVSPHTTDRVITTGTGPLFLKTAAQGSNGWQVVNAMERNLPADLRLFVIMVDAPPSYEGGPPVRGTFVYDFKRPPMKFRDQ